MVSKKSALLRVPSLVIQIRHQSHFHEKPRINGVGIQYLSHKLQNQVFPKATTSTKTKKSAENLILLSQKHLANNELLGKRTGISEPIAFEIPKLQGDTLDEHFYKLGLHSSAKYMDIVDKLIRIGDNLPQQPKKWLFKSGWYKYVPGKRPVKVPFPQDEGLVFDVETLYKLSPYPVMATCVSTTAWYAWVSPYLTKESPTNDHLIPLDTFDRERVIVGHNVSYDRARLQSEYSLKESKLFFLDTMSLHVSVSGMCSRQRGTWLKYKKSRDLKLKLSSEQNDTSLELLRAQSTSAELQSMLNNPVLDLELGTQSQDLLDDPWMNFSSLNSLKHVADFHCNIKLEKDVRDYFASEDPKLVTDNFQTLMAYCAHDVYATFKVFHKIFPQFKEVIAHPVSFAALKHIAQSFLPTSRQWEHYIAELERIYVESTSKIERNLHDIANKTVALKDDPSRPWESDPWLSQLDWTMLPVKLTKKGEPYKNQKLPGYPEWYRSLIVKKELKLTTRSRSAPLLLKLSWESHPLFWLDSQGWCFVTDFGDLDKYKRQNYTHVGIEKLSQDPKFDLIPEQYIYKKCFFKVPHSDGPSARTVSIMTKSFLLHFESGLLTSEFELAKDALQLAVSCSYWTSARERIINQMVVYLDEHPEVGIASEGDTSFNGLDKNASDTNLDRKLDKLDKNGSNLIENNAKSNQNVTKSDKTPHTPLPSSSLGMIIPQIVPMGTVTRRAVENTWLTASNAKKNRLGSELKSMIKAPKGYCFVGADVDSEELWIASIVGDSVFQIHGGTAIGWMTLEGTKSEGTDLHSKTANILGITRNDAKTFNYGRIYGAGVKFAATLLKKFNPTLSDADAAAAAKKLYAETKGKTGLFNGKKLWYGGSESIVFNRLEKIAESPRTPTLGAGITAALKQDNLLLNSFLPSRINWAIQSSGVDYLHLLIVSMEYLKKIYNVDARLSITVHDEIRYLVKEQDKYKAALLLQVSNLWTRLMFSSQLGMHELPQSCAFFSAVDIDHVLRKEVDLDCVTPSNKTPIAHGESIDVLQLLEKPGMRRFFETVVPEVDLSHLPYQRSKPIVEELDEEYDSSAFQKFVEMQIVKDDKEFKALKSELRRALNSHRQYSQRKKFESDSMDKPKRRTRTKRPETKMRELLKEAENREYIYGQEPVQKLDDMGDKRVYYDLSAEEMLEVFRR